MVELDELNTCIDGSAWAAAPQAPVIEDGEIHVWRVSVEHFRSRIEQLIALLDEEERTRMARFHFARDRERFAVSHGTRREILSKYLHQTPMSLRFDVGEYGKPRIAAGAFASDLRFNASDSGDWVVLAIALGREVGVDVERIDAACAGPDIAQRFFSAAELDALSHLDDEHRVEGFFDCWARKEAYIKVIGKGLNFPLDAFAVSLDPEHAALLSVHGCAREAAHWQMKSLTVSPGYKSALAVSGRIGEVRTWTLMQ